MIDEAVFLFTNEHKVDKVRLFNIEFIKNKKFKQPMKILKEFENLKQQFKKNDLSKVFEIN